MSDFFGQLSSMRMTVTSQCFKNQVLRLKRKPSQNQVSILKPGSVFGSDPFQNQVSKSKPGFLRLCPPPAMYQVPYPTYRSRFSPQHSSLSPQFSTLKSHLSILSFDIPHTTSDIPFFDLPHTLFRLAPQSSTLKSHLSILSFDLPHTTNSYASCAYRPGLKSSVPRFPFGSIG